MYHVLGICGIEREIKKQTKKQHSLIKKKAVEFQFQLIFISFLEKVLYTSLYQQSDRQWMDTI